MNKICGECLNKNLEKMAKVLDPRFHFEVENSNTLPADASTPLAFKPGATVKAMIPYAFPNVDFAIVIDAYVKRLLLNLPRQSGITVVALAWLICRRVVQAQTRCATATTA